MAVRRALGMAASVCPATAAWAGLTGPAGASPTTLFSSTKPGFVANAATVPAGICFVTIAADGGHGGANGDGTFGGGRGASVQARVPVTPGASLDVMVGQGGAAGSSGGATNNGASSSPGAGGGAGGVGFAGGGAGGSSFVPSTATSVSAALSARTGDGQVTISFDPNTDACTPEVPAAVVASTTPTVVAPPNFTG